MFEHFTTSEEIFSYKLGSALTMEHDSLEMLAEMEKTAMRSDLKDLFREHAHETRQQMENLQRCFTLLGEEVRQAPSPTTKGLAKEARSFTAKTDNSLVDTVVLAGALETEHYEVAVYEILISHAKSRGMTGIVALLSQNLEQEEAAIGKIKAAADVVTRGEASDQNRSGTVPERTHTVRPFFPPKNN